MASQNARQDQNRFPALIGVGGTAGTADAAGTADIVQISANPTTGAMYVQDLSGASGTTTVQMVSGTLNVGTVVVSSSSGGTTVNIATGTQQTLGTVGVVNNLVKGTITALETGTLTALAVGTIGGKAASGAAAVANPVQIAGTDAGGTIYSPLIDTAGVQRSSGSHVMTVGTLTTGTLQNLVTGTINALAAGTITGGTLGNLNAGTITSVAEIVKGTTTLVTRVGNVGTVELGSVVVTTLPSGGTILNLASGTLAVVTTVTTVSNLTNGSVAVTIGSIVGPNASGGTSNTSPVQIGGTTSTGTVYGMLVDTAGNPQVDVLTIPQVSVGTLPTLNLTTGTITTGSLTNLATLHNGTVVVATGTQQTLGTVGVVNNLVTGTLAALTTVTTVSNLTNGSVNILTGTIQSSGTTTGVGVVSNLTNGSVNVLTGTVTSVTNLAAGTVQINPVPVPTTLTFGTLGTAGGSFFATISAASGAGTKHYVTGVDIVMSSGTADVRVLAGSAIQGTGVLAAGNFPAGGGISNHFNPAFVTGTNSELIYHFVGAGTAFITARYWKGT